MWMGFIGFRPSDTKISASSYRVTRHEPPLMTALLIFATNAVYTTKLFIGSFNLLRWWESERYNQILRRPLEPNAFHSQIFIGERSSRMTPSERREAARLRSERWRRARGIMPRRKAAQPWLALGISRSTYYRRRAKAREQAAAATRRQRGRRCSTASTGKWHDCSVSLKPPRGLWTRGRRSSPSWPRWQAVP